jgi:hypothetical protein
MSTAVWRAWLAIFIDGGGGEVRWAKAHLYESRHRAPQHPVSALEGLEAPGEVVLWIGRPDRIEVLRSAFAPGDPRRGEDAWEVQLDDRFHARPAGERHELGCQLSGHSLAAEGSASDRLLWAHLPRLLRYESRFGPFSARIDGLPLTGLGVIERASGGTLPFDPRRLVRGPWHWDVLVFDGGGWAAGLALPIPGLGTRGVRAGGCLPGEARPISRFGGGFRIEELERDGELPFGLRRWQGWLSLGGAKLVYEAKVTTPLAPAIDSGVFAGFAFEGELAGRGGRRAVRGNGFAEMGGAA